MLLFIDTSYYDPIVDWKRYIWDGAFIKCSEGIVQDLLFQQQWKAANGWIIRAPYHFFHPAIDPKATSEKFVKYLGNDLGELPPVLDMEVTNGMSPSHVAEAGLEWLHETTRRTGRMPIVYTSPNFIYEQELGRYPEYGNYRLWLATYPRDKITMTWTEELRKNWIYTTIISRSILFPNAKSPFKLVDFLQWTGKCPPDFIPGYPLGKKLAVDVSFFAGSMNELFKRYNIKYVPPDKGDDDMEPITIEADLRDLQPSNLRPSAGLQTGLIRTMTGPVHVECIGAKKFVDGYYWSQVVKVDGQAENGWIAWTTAYENVILHDTTPLPTGKKIKKSIIVWDDDTVTELFPTQ